MLFRIVLLSLLLAVAACQQKTGESVGGETVTIYRDNFGTPHVVADSNRGVFYGYGYAVATDRLFQMEMLKRTTQDRVAEALGEEYLELDSFLRTGYDHRAVRRQLEDLPPAERELLQGYADGFSARVAEVLASKEILLPAEFNHYDFLPQPWTDVDVVMAFVGSIAHRYSDFNSERDNLALLRHLEARHGKDVAWRIFSASKWLLDDDSPTTVPRTGQNVAPAMPARPAYLDSLAVTEPTTRLAYNEDGRFNGLTSDPAMRARHVERIAANGFSGHPEFMGASNYWAVRKLEDAAAALINGPQFGFSVPGYVYGIGLHGGDFNTVGNTLLALPSLLFAHNNVIAWGSTAGISDQTDEYALTLDPNNPERYWHNEGWRDFERWQETVAVKGRADVTVTARRSVHGMVLAHSADDGLAWAWARARAWEGQELASLMAWTLLPTDKSLDEAHRRIGKMATNINMYTMDATGNLGYVHAGRYPDRAPGHDPRLPAPGDGGQDWRGLRPYSDNPTVRNPERGYIANWNNRPSGDWLSSDLWTYTWSRADRGSILFDLIENNSTNTVESVQAINQKATYADVSAPFVLPYLLAALAEDQAGSDPLVVQAVALLRDWDQQWRLGEDGNYGPAATIMEAWLKGLLVAALRDDIGEEYFHLYSATNYPNSTLGPSIPNPPGVKALQRNLDALAAGREPDYDFFNGDNPAVMLRESFTSAMVELAAAQGEDIATWRLSPEPMRWQPNNFRGVPQALPSAVQTLPAYMNRGSENNLFVATGQGIEARDVIPPGQSGFYGPDGKAARHVLDQMDLFVAFADKPVPFSVEQVKAAAVTVEELQLAP